MPSLVATLSRVPQILMYMNKKKVILFGSLFGLTIIFSFWGIIQMSKTGGPCNSGIAFIILTPAVVLLSIMQLSILNYLLYSVRKNSLSWGIISLIFTLIWVFLMNMFSDDKKIIIYLTPFLLFNILVTFFSFKYKPTTISKENNSS